MCVKVNSFGTVEVCDRPNQTLVRLIGRFKQGDVDVADELVPMSGAMEHRATGAQSTLPDARGHQPTNRPEMLATVTITSTSRPLAGLTYGWESHASLGSLIGHIGRLALLAAFSYLSLSELGGWLE